MYRPVHLTRKVNLPASAWQQPAGLMPVPQVRQGQCRGHFFPPSFPPHSCVPPHPPPPWAAVPSGHYQLSHGATCSTGLTVPLSQLFLPFLTQDFPEAPTCSWGAQPVVGPLKPAGIGCVQHGAAPATPHRGCPDSPHLASYARYS